MKTAELKRQVWQAVKAEPRLRILSALGILIACWLFLSCVFTAVPAPFYICCGILCALVAAGKALAEDGSPILKKFAYNARVLRVICLALALTTLILCFQLDCLHSILFLFRFIVPLLLVPIVLMLSVASKGFLLRRTGSNWQARTLKSFWHDLTMSGFMASFLAVIACFFFLPDGLGDWLASWLDYSAADAGMGPQVMLLHDGAPIFEQWNG